MAQTDIFARVQAIDLPPSEYVVIGSGVLNAVGLRESRDIDLVVSEQAFAELRQRPGWKLTQKHGEPCLEKDDFEVWLDWGPDMPDFKTMFREALVVRGLHFASFETVMRFKRLHPTDKNLRDIVLIEQYLSAKKGIIE